MESPPAKATLANVEILRFVAAVFVLVEHLLQSLDRGYIQSGTAIVPIIPVLWRSGVDIFFVISGFIMLYVSGRQFGKPGAWRTFALRRVIRVAPMYWLFTTLMVAAAIALPGRINNGTIDPVHLALSYLFVPWPRPDGALEPFLGPGWTLNYEMLFYAVFTVALLFRKTIGIALIGAVFLSLIAAGRVFGSAMGPFTFWTQPLILEFLYGIGLAWLYLRGVRLRAAARITLILLGLAIGGWAELNDFPFQTRCLWAGIPALFIAAGVVLGQEMPDSRLRRALVLGGGASYALYLSHLFVLKAVGIAWDKTHLHSIPGFLLTAGVCATGAAVLVHLYVERPMLRLSRRLLEGDRAAAAAAAPSRAES